MAYIIGKIRREYKNILQQNENILNQFNQDDFEIIEFTPGHKLDEDQWCHITNFSETDFCIPECNRAFSTASLNQIENNDYRNLSVICIDQDNQKYFQRITPSLFIHRKTFLNYEGTPRIREYRKQIEIKDISDAIYIPENDILYFKSISKIKLIFPGIEELYREATQEEIDEFLNNDFIELENVTNNSIGSMNRKRIADIGGKYESLTEAKKQELIEYAREKAGVELDGDSFIIRNETDLKNVLYAMDQRYYYADIYEENRIANSVRIVSEAN